MNNIFGVYIPFRKSAVILDKQSKKHLGDLQEILLNTSKLSQIDFT